MKKKYFKRLVTVTLAIILSLSMCACGKNDGSTINEKKENAASSCFSTDTNAIWYYIEPDNGYVIGKDMEVEQAYVFADGKCNRYDVNGAYTLGELSQISDEEIIAMLEENCSFPIDSGSIIGEKEACEQILASEYMEDCTINYPLESKYGYKPQEQFTYSFENMSVVKEAIEKYKNELDEVIDNRGNVTEAACTLAIYTDSTGNNTSYEEVVFEYTPIRSCGAASTLAEGLSDIEQDFWAALYVLNNLDEYITYNTEYYDVEDLESGFNEYDLLEIVELFGGLPSKYIIEECAIDAIIKDTKSDKIVLINGMDGSTGNAQVYDSYYGGFLCEGYNYLLTRTGENTSFKLDEVGTEGIAVDPK